MYYCSIAVDIGALTLLKYLSEYRPMSEAIYTSSDELERIISNGDNKTANAIAI